jgi:hypothetical protein
MAAGRQDNPWRDPDRPAPPAYSPGLLLAILGWAGFLSAAVAVFLFSGAVDLSGITLAQEVVSLVWVAVGLLGLLVAAVCLGARYIVRELRQR